MLAESTCLFDTRGGSLKVHNCEVCDDLLDPESIVPVCPECNADYEEEDL